MRHLPSKEGFPGASDSKESSRNAGDLSLIPGLGRSPGEEMATGSNIFAWRIPWTVEPGRLLSTGSQRVGHTEHLSTAHSPLKKGLPCKRANSPSFLVFEFNITVQKHQFSMILSSVQSLSRVGLFATPWTAARQASLSITNSQSLLKLMSIESVMPSNHLILCHPLLLPPSIFPSIRVFSNESVLCIRWPKYWGFSFSISPFNEYSGLISFRMD